MADEGDNRKGQERDDFGLDLQFLAMQLLELLPRDYDLARRVLAHTREHLDRIHNRGGGGATSAGVWVLAVISVIAFGAGLA